MFRSPSHAGLPALQTMLEDIALPLRQVARHLGIKESTLATYKRRGQAPRSIMLALFWETKWGRSAADTEAVNWGALHYRSHMIANRELQRMAAILAKLEDELTRADRAANGPVYRVR